MGTDEKQEALRKQNEAVEELLSNLDDVFEPRAPLYTVYSDSEPCMSKVSMKVCSGYIKDETNKYLSRRDARYSRLQHSNWSHRASIALHGSNVDLNKSGFILHNERFVTTYRNVRVLNQYARILDQFFNTTVVKHLIYDNDVRNIDIDIYADEFYEDDGDIFSQGVTMYEAYRTCSVKVTINRKRDRACIFKLYLAQHEDGSLKVIYTSVFREVGLTEIRCQHIGSTSSPLTETMLTRMYNAELNSMFSDIARPKPRQENTFFAEANNESKQVRSSRLFF